MDLSPGRSPVVGDSSETEHRDLSPYVPSPCVGICVLDERGWCEGCLRTGAEIAAWPTLGPENQRRLLTVLSARWAELGL